MAKPSTQPPDRRSRLGKGHGAHQAPSQGAVQLHAIVAHAVRQWQDLVAEQGGPAALSAVLQGLVRQGMRRNADSAPLTEPEWATLMGRALMVSDPARAMQATRHALALDDSRAENWLLLGTLQDKLGERAAAKTTMQHVLELPQADPTQRLAAANMLVRLGEQASAQRAALQAFEDLGRPLDKAAALLYIVQRTAHWPAMEALTAQLRAAYQDGLFGQASESPRTHLNWCADEAFNVAVVSEWSRRHFALAAPATPPPAPRPLAGRRLRVGYLSSDYREHPTARLIKGLLRHHDRSRVEVLLYCSGWDDGSALRKEVLSLAEQVHTVTHLSDAEAAALIRSHGVDVLVELNGPTRAHRMGVLAHRPAPVQVDYLGFPGSVGGHVVDYVVADPYVLPPGQEALYPERVIRLSHTYQVNDYAAQPRPVPPSREAAGLPPGNWRVLGAFNGIEKVHAEVWATWMDILRQVPNALLWLLDPGPVAWAQVQAVTRAHGIDPARVVRAPRQKQEAHWARMACCDLMLDPWPYGGHTTTADALFAGVPVLALEGTNFASRVSGGLLHAAGLPALVAPTMQAYVSLAVNLLRNAQALAQLQAAVREVVPGSPVFDSVGKARQMEAAYRALVQRVIDGRPPEHTDALACLQAEQVSTADVAGPKPVSLRYLTPLRPPADGVVAFGIIRNERYFMPHFLAHYRALGVASFVLLDDGSDDGTREYLMAQPDCCVLQASHRFGDPVQGQPFHAWAKEHVPRRLLPNRWVLTVDADEFLLMPPPWTSLAAWCEHLDAQGANHVRALMLDFFPDRLADLEAADPTAAPWDLCPWVDAPGVVDWPAGAPAPRRLSMPDCVRPRLFQALMQQAPDLQADFRDYKLANLNKVPLLKWVPGVAPVSSHRVNVPVSDRNQVVLAHFKFYPGWLAKARQAVAEATHWNGAIEYRMLSQAGQRLADWPLNGPRSHRYQGPAQLAALNLLFADASPVPVASPAPGAWVTVGHSRFEPGCWQGMRQPAVVLRVTLSPQPVDAAALQAFDALHRAVFAAPEPAHAPGASAQALASVDPAASGHPLLGRLLRLALDVLERMGMPVMGGARALPSDPPHSGEWLVGLPAVAAGNGAPQAAFSLACILMNGLAAGRATDARTLERELRKQVQRFQPLAPAGVNTLRFLQAAHELNIPWCHIANNVYQFGWGRRARWLDSSFTDETSTISAGLARDKVACAQVLRAVGLPVPRHQQVTSASQAVEVAEALGYPVVVKPADLDGGRGVLAGVRDESGVRQAFEAAIQRSKRVLVEQFIEGNDYRVRICKGAVIGAVIRRPAAVVGDGASSVQELIDRTNAQRQKVTTVLDAALEQGAKPITVDDEVRQWLAAQGLGLDSVIPSGQRVRLRGAANVSLGGTTWDVTPQAHPDNLALAVQAAAALRLDVAGVDLLLPDIAQSWQQTGGAICEVNGQPQFSSGPAHRDVLGRLVRGQGRIPVVAITGWAPAGELRQAVIQGLREKGLCIEWAATPEEGLQALRRPGVDGLVWQLEALAPSGAATPVDALDVWVHPRDGVPPQCPGIFGQAGTRWALDNTTDATHLADRLIAFFSNFSATEQPQ